LEELKQLAVISAKVDGVDGKLTELNNTVSGLRVDVDANKASIATLTADLAAHKDLTSKEINALKLGFNQREQQLRSNTIRIFNLPHSPGESVDNYRNLAVKVYDRLLLPALTAAAEGGELGRVPPQQSTIESCFRAFSINEPDPGAPPMPVICRLTNRHIKTCILKHKKIATTQSEAERAARVKRVVMVEDLTPPTHALLKALQADARVGKVWSINGQIQFTLAGKEGFHRVKNVFIPAADIVSAVAGK